MFSKNLSLVLIVTVIFVHKTFASDASLPNSPVVESIDFGNKSVFRTLGIGYCVFVDSLSRSKLKYLNLPSTTRQRLVLLYLLCLLLSNSYSPEPNPGPSIASPPVWTQQISKPHDTDSRTYCLSPSQTHSSWLCGACDLPVGWSDRGLACEQCGQWFHGQCQSVDSRNYEALANSDAHWYCAICGNPNSATAFDLHGVDWTDPSLPYLSWDSCTTPTELHFKPQHASTPTRASQQDKWKDRPLRVLNINFQSACAKRAEIPNLLNSLKPDIIIGTETWLDPSISNAEINFPDIYTVYRRDREERSGGGVLIALRGNLDSYIAPELEIDDCELLWVRVKLKGRRTLYVGAYYRPDVTDERSLIKLGISLQRSSALQNAYLLIGGDFNFPGWDWEKETLKPGTPCPRLHNDFLGMIHDNGLEQLVKEPTREDNTLDLFLTNCPQLVPRIEVVPGLSDHSIPYCEFALTLQKKRQVQRKIPLYAKADWVNLREAAKDLSSLLQQMQGSASTEELWLKLKTTLMDAVQTYIPHKTARVKTSQPWVTPGIRRLINRRDRIYRQMKKTGTEKLKKEVKNLRRTIQRQMRQSYWSYLNETFLNNTDPYQAGKNKRFWTYVKNQKSSNIGVAPLKRDGQLTSDPKIQAEILNEQFQSAFSDGAQYTEEQFQKKTGMISQGCPVMDNIIITERGVRKLMANLNPHKATGPDGIGPRILKELSEELAPAMTIIFQSSMKTGIVPSDWRDAHVTPIFKKGEQYNPANYRPISLTCVSCKMMEHILVSAVMQHFDDHQVLTDNQHGFRRGRSCETQLLEFAEELTSSMESGRQTDVLIMDFAKAFDRVNHSLLLHKLRCYGVQGPALTWISSFLSDRRQAVVVNGSRSDFVPVRSGVPQGSVLGPCLFLAYINDLPDKLTALTRLFADDTAVYRVVSNISDQNQLQLDLHRLEEWEMSWNMMFHPAKCNTLLITRSRRPLSAAYQLHNQTLETVSSAKYLGVTIRRDMSWDEHTDSIANKANKTLGFLRRNLKINSAAIKEQAYKAFVRPILEYASTVWDPHTKKAIDRLEAVQRRAARFVLNRYHNTSSVNQMLDSLGWSSLELRRKTSRLSMLYKINRGLVHCPSILTKMIPLPLRQRRGHDSQFSRITCRTEYRSSSFLPRTIKDWNALPQEVVEATTVDAFASRASHRPE